MQKETKTSTKTSAKTSNHEEKLSNKRSRRESEELLLKDILLEVEMGDEAYWLERTKQWADDPDRAPSPEQRAAFEGRLDLEVQRIQKQKRQTAQTRSRRKRLTASVLHKVAVILVFVTVFASTMLYCTVDAFAAGVDRFIATVMVADGAEELRLEDKNGGGIELDPADFAGMYFPEWLPKGYFVSDVIFGTHRDIIYFADKKESIICYEISPQMYSVVLDDEEVETERIYVHDTWGKIITTDETVYVVWEDGEYLYTISGNIGLREELIKMVEKSAKIEAEN